MKISSGPWKVAIGADQAMENWMVATLGASMEHRDETIYVTTDHVHASEAESYPFEDAQFIVKCRNYAHEHGDPIERIEALEGALTSCIFALKKQREASHQWDRTVDGAIEASQKVLALSSSV
jgi:hypothetical protein